MKILHTSDWHLGQNFFNQSRKAEHQAFLVWLIDTIIKHKVDAVIVAGDVFDTGTPPSYAREIYNDFVVTLQNHTCSLIVLGGNHDAVSMLNESKSVLACLNTYVVASTDLPLAEQVIPLKDVSGDVGALLCAVPFIRAKDVMHSKSGETGLEKRQTLGEAIKQHYDDVYALAAEQKGALNKPVPIIATGHLSAMGVTQSDSVRDIYIGNLDGFAASGFPPADYIALGHIHKPQIVAKSEHIRYCGSPIPLSFDEINTQKQVVLVEFDENQSRTITPITVPRFQALAVIHGDLATIENALNELPEQLNGQTTWLCIEVVTEDFLSDLQARIQTLVEGKPVKVLQIKRVKNAQRQLLSQEKQETLIELSPVDVFEKRLAMETLEDETSEQRAERARKGFQVALDQVQHKDTDA